MPTVKMLNRSIDQAPPVNLTDAATIATDASLCDHYRVTITADRTLGIPTNPTDAQRAIWEVTASGAQRQLTLTTGSSGAFELTVGTSTPVVIPSGKAAIIGAQYNTSRARWTVLAVRVLA